MEYLLVRGSAAVAALCSDREATALLAALATGGWWAGGGAGGAGGGAVMLNGCDSVRARCVAS
jgi:hypothetical protein